MQNIEEDIILSEIEALVLHRANKIHKQSQEEKTLAEAVDDYLFTLYEGLRKSGKIKESYKDFESKWFCEYYNDPDGEGTYCMVNDIYEDMICSFLGYDSLAECEDYEEIKALVNSSSGTSALYLNKITGEIYCEVSDITIAGALLEQINQDISRLIKAK